MTAFGSFSNNTGKRVLDLLEAGDLRLRQVVVEDRCLSVCNVGVLWPNRSMDPDATG